MVKAFAPKEANWRENNYHHCGRWAQIPTKFIHCQISVECHQSFNDTEHKSVLEL
jgi:hypothetical protein